MPLLRSRGRKSLATSGFAGAYLARQGKYTLSPKTALLLRNKSTAKGVIYYGSFPGAYLARKGIYTLSPETALLLRNKSKAKEL